MNILIVFKIIATLLSPLTGEVLFESLESKTKEGDPVFNMVTLHREGGVDVWSMKQSHHGCPSETWDTIQIKVYPDKTVTYHQLEDGLEIEYKASCVRCHSGGPRFIRPRLDSKAAPVGAIEKTKIFALNMKIKSYGDLKLKENLAIKRRVGLIKNQNLANKPFVVKTCQQCHYEGGPRAELSFEQLETIKFLVHKKQMPPWPYKLTKVEKINLNKLIYGF